MHLGRLDEAQAALEQALKKEPEYADAIANILVLSVVSGKDPKEYIEYVLSIPLFLTLPSFSFFPYHTCPATFMLLIASSAACVFGYQL